jgi:multidrug resistance protein
MSKYHDMDILPSRRASPVRKADPINESFTRAISASKAPSKEALPSCPAPYTTFTSNEKRLLTLLLGLATITSPLTATVYFPLLPLLRTHFKTSAQAINLTITLYVIFQALSPAVFGPLSDSLGRRPVCLITLSLYAVGNLGLALNKHSYSVLLGLRALQAIGASAAFSVSYGVVADVCVPSERGKMLGPVSMALNLGACIGPVVGGWVAYSSGSYEWVFWALVIVAALLLLIVLIFLPETARNVVQNGTGRLQEKWWEASWLSLLMSWKRNRRLTTKAGSSARQQEESQTHHRVSLRKRFRIRNPLACLSIVFHRDTILALWIHGSFYTVDYSFVAALPDIYKTIYHFNELQIGLAYLPRGAGIIVGGFVNGKWMDYNYRVTAKQIGHEVDKVHGDDLEHFPIERARSRGSFHLLVWSTATMIAYGWVVHKHANVTILLVLQFMQGFWGTCFYTIYNTLLVDIFPQSPSTAAAAASIVRCSMAAAGVAVLQPLLDAVGRGWYFTTLALWSGTFGALAIWTIKKYGMIWRLGRIEKNKVSSNPKPGASDSNTQGRMKSEVEEEKTPPTNILQQEKA